MQKKLPAVLQNDIISFNNYALPLCVVSGNDKKKEWLLEHFGNIYYQKNDNGYVMLDFLEQYDYPKDVLEYQFMTYEKYGNLQDIVSHVKDRIDQEYQVMIIVDNDCLKEKREHPLRHFPMQVFIYGYDDEEEIFLGMGYHSDFIFGEVTYGYKEIREAYQSFRKHYQVQEDWVSMYAEIYMKVKEPENEYHCSCDKILEELEEYVYSKICMNKIRPEFLLGGNNPEVVFGMEAQKAALGAFYQLLEGEFKTDYRVIHLLYEQKRHILKKIEKLSNENRIGENGIELKEEYQKQVVKKVNKARLIFMMQVIEDNGKSQFYAQLKDKEAIRAVIKLIEEALNQEEIILGKIV